MSKAKPCKAVAGDLDYWVPAFDCLILLNGFEGENLRRYFEQFNGLPVKASKPLEHWQMQDGDR